MQDILNDNVDEKNAEANFISWYEEVVVERLAMLENEERYKKRVKELETNIRDMTVALTESENEIKHVREKYEPDDEGIVYNEPYKDVYEEREKLIQRKRSLDKEVSGLKGELTTLRDYVKGLETNPDKTRQKKTGGQGYIVITGEERVTDLEAENEQLKEKIGKLENNINTLLTQRKQQDERLVDRQPLHPYDKKRKGSSDSDKSDTYLPKIFESRNSESSLESYDKGRSSLPSSQYSESKGVQGTYSRISDTKREDFSSRLSDVTLPSIHENAASPSLLYGLNYVTLHKLRAKSRNGAKSKASNYSYI